MGFGDLAQIFEMVRGCDDVVDKINKYVKTLYACMRREQFKPLKTPDLKNEVDWNVSYPLFKKWFKKYNNQYLILNKLRAKLIKPHVLDQIYEKYKDILKYFSREQIIIIITQWYIDNYNEFWLDYYTITLLVDDTIDVNPDILNVVDPFNDVFRSLN